MAFLGLVVPELVAQALAIQEVGGARIDPSVMHVTMLYLGKEVPIDDIVAAIRVVFGVAEKSVPFRCRIDSIGSFPVNADGKIPIIAHVQSPELEQLRASLVSLFDELGVPFSKKFHEYQPHCTLSYIVGTESETRYDRTIPTITWKVQDLVMWCGDRDDDGMEVRIPLGHQADESQAALATLRVALMVHRG